MRAQGLVMAGWLSLVVGMASCKTREVGPSPITAIEPEAVPTTAMCLEHGNAGSGPRSAAFDEASRQLFRCSAALFAERLKQVGDKWLQGVKRRDGAFALAAAVARVISEAMVVVEDDLTFADLKSKRWWTTRFESAFTQEAGEPISPESVAALATAFSAAVSETVGVKRTLPQIVAHLVENSGENGLFAVTIAQKDHALQCIDAYCNAVHSEIPKARVELSVGEMVAGARERLTEFGVVVDGATAGAKVGGEVDRITDPNFSRTWNCRTLMTACRNECIDVGLQYGALVAEHGVKLKAFNPRSCTLTCLGITDVIFITEIAGSRSGGVACAEIEEIKTALATITAKRPALSDRANHGKRP